MKKVTLALVPLCIGAFILMAADTKAPPSDPDRLKQATDRFMSLVTKGQTTEAFTALFRSYWYRETEAVAEATGLDNQYRTVRNRLDEQMDKQSPGAYEFLGRRRLGNSLVTLVYVQKYESAGWPWAFTFYKAQDEWKLRSVTFGENAWDDMMAMTVAEPAR